MAVMPLFREFINCVQCTLVVLHEENMHHNTKSVTFHYINLSQFVVFVCKDFNLTHYNCC